MHPHRRIPERSKAYVLCADLAAAMAYIMLVRDLEEVPRGTHDWMISCHGWGILFLQVRPRHAHCTSQPQQLSQTLSLESRPMLRCLQCCLLVRMTPVLRGLLLPWVVHVCTSTQLYTLPRMQATSVSAVNLHTINILCYALIEAYLWLEFGEAAFMRGGVAHVLLMLLLCSALPLVANVAEEVQSRRAFLNR